MPCRFTILDCVKTQVVRDRLPRLAPSSDGESSSADRTMAPSAAHQIWRAGVAYRTAIRTHHRSHQLHHTAASHSSQPHIHLRSQVPCHPATYNAYNSSLMSVYAGPQPPAPSHISVYSNSARLLKCSSADLGWHRDWGGGAGGHMRRMPKCSSAGPADNGTGNGWGLDGDGRGRGQGVR